MAARKCAHRRTSRMLLRQRLQRRIGEGVSGIRRRRTNEALVLLCRVVDVMEERVKITLLMRDVWPAPQMTGDAYPERCVRAHTNTVEWTPIFFPAMWLFAVYWSSLWASLFGCAWIVGRICISSATSPIHRNDIADFPSIGGGVRAVSRSVGKGFSISPWLREDISDCASSQNVYLTGVAR